MKREVGHELLARLGKMRLRPGGIEATGWLFEHIEWRGGMKVLEVACNHGRNLSELAGEHDAEFVGLDLEEDVLDRAKKLLDQTKLKGKVSLIQGDARKLPFEDESFDVVINEAMLTMLSQKDKERAVAEYYRVLKKGGILLTQDVVLKGVVAPAVIKLLQKVIHVPAQPLSEAKWRELFEKAGFASEVKTGEMTLLSEEGLLRDEGAENKERILRNAEHDANREQFEEMREFFEKQKDRLHYIAVVSKK